MNTGVDFSNAKVGDDVYSILNGKGVVTDRLTSKSGRFNKIIVEFKENIKAIYFMDGREYKDDLIPTLYPLGHKDITIGIPKADMYKELKEKYATGDYIHVARLFGVWGIPRDPLEFEMYSEHKLIHKKHKEVLNHYLLNGNKNIVINIFTGDGITETKLNKDWDFIDYYNENSDYSIIYTYEWLWSIKTDNVWELSSKYYSSKEELDSDLPNRTAIKLQNTKRERK